MIIEEAAPQTQTKQQLPVFLLVFGLCVIEAKITISPYRITGFADMQRLLVFELLLIVTSAVAVLMLGSLSDYYGRRNVLVWSQAFVLWGGVIWWVSKTVFKIISPDLYEAITIGSTALAAATIPVLYASMADRTLERDRIRLFGLLIVIASVAASVGLFIADAILRILHVETADIIVVSLLVIILIFRFWKEPPKPVQTDGLSRAAFPSFHALLKACVRSNIQLLIVILFVQQTAFHSLSFLLTPFRVSRTGQWIAIENLFVGGIALVIQLYFIGRWRQRWGESRLIYSGLAVLTLGLLLLVITPTQAVPDYNQAAMREFLQRTQFYDYALPLPDDTSHGWLGLAWYLLAIIPIMIGGSILLPAIYSRLTQLDAHYGMVLGLGVMIFNLATNLAPLFGDKLLRFGGPSLPLLVGLAALSLMLIIARRPLQVRVAE